MGVAEPIFDNLTIICKLTIFQFENRLQFKMAKAEYKTQTRQMILDYMVENPDRIFKASEIAESLRRLVYSVYIKEKSAAGVAQYHLSQPFPAPGGGNGADCWCREE